jgi:hypothetical protein
MFVVEPIEEEKVQRFTTRIGAEPISIDIFIPAGCEILQYAHDVVVYALHRITYIARALVQTACSALKGFFLIWLD